MKRVFGYLALMLLRVLLVCVIAAGLYRLGAYSYNFGRQIYSEQGVEMEPGRDIAVVVFEGESVRDVGKMLESFGLIRDEKVFYVQERLSKYSGQMKAGNYVLNTSMSGSEMIEILSGNKKENQDRGVQS